MNTQNPIAVLSGNDKPRLHYTWEHENTFRLLSQGQGARRVLIKPRQSLLSILINRASARGLDLTIIQGVEEERDQQQDAYLNQESGYSSWLRAIRSVHRDFQLAGILVFH